MPAGAGPDWHGPGGRQHCLGAGPNAHRRAHRPPAPEAGAAAGQHRADCGGRAGHGFLYHPARGNGRAGAGGRGGAIFPPCLAAIALGLVGRARFDQAQGTNQAFNAAGNMFAALALGAAGYYFSLRWMFYLIAALGVGAVLCVLRIKAADIDFDLARGADEAAGGADKSAVPSASIGQTIKELLEGFRDLLRQKAVLVFLVSAVIFYFANAAMVPLVTQLLAGGVGPKQAVLFTSGYRLASQLVFMVVAVACGRLAGKLGRKPLFLFGFVALAARGGALYAQPPPGRAHRGAVYEWAGSGHFWGGGRAHYRRPHQGHGALQCGAGCHCHGPGHRRIFEQLGGRPPGQKPGLRFYFSGAGRHCGHRAGFSLAADA